ncbi:MAG: hypothetical protein ABIC19_01310 [Patescibacteria group bacterium]
MFAAFFANIFKDAADWFIRLVYFWLVQGPARFWKKALGFSVIFEDGWATWITFRNLFSPLYGDYSIIGRILGPFFRLGRLLIGLTVHAGLFVVYLALFFVFCLIFLGAPFLFVINLFIWNQ